MQTFGKRQYGHMELDPWVQKKKPRGEMARERSVPSSRIAGYVIAMVMVGVLAVAGFEILVMA
ncbi:MAG: hypothetical protein KL863_26350 [Rhizobium sp.]|nr:hypothetical protein [Rhizobium sp.]